MRATLLIGSSLCLAAAVFPQSISVHGRITNVADQAVANAKVELLRAKRSAVSGADGMYALTGGTALRPSSPGPSGNIRFGNGVLEVGLSVSQPIRIGIFDAQGHELDNLVLERPEAGEYRIPVAGRVRARGILIVTASVGRETRSFRYFAPEEGGPAAVVDGSEGGTRGEFPSIGAALAKVSAVVDTLQFTAAGYAAKRVEISSYDTTVDVALNAAEDRWGGLKNPPGPSAGCGKTPATLKQGKNGITTGGARRDFIIDIPADYKPDHPYRLFFCFHWYGGSADSIASGQVEFGRGSGPDYAYYGLKRLAGLANEPAIFIAPQGLNNGWGGGQTDHRFFEDMLALAKSDLCVDTTRVFSTGFSFGSMFTYSLTTNHQKQLRAGVGIAPANWNIWLPSPLPRDPIAWMQTTGMSDPNCKWINDAGKQEGAKFIALQRGQDNGCTVPADIPTAAVGSRTHQCYDFAGCKAGYPVKACTFDGAHIANVGDGGTGNVGKDSWIPAESWKFFSQF